MQSGIIENISWLKIKMRIKPEYNIQYNRKKTNNLSYFIDVEFFSEIFYNSLPESFLYYMAFATLGKSLYVLWS